MRIRGGATNLTLTRFACSGSARLAPPLLPPPRHPRLPSQPLPQAMRRRRTRPTRAPRRRSLQLVLRPLLNPRRSLSLNSSPRLLPPPKRALPILRRLQHRLSSRRSPNPPNLSPRPRPTPVPLVLPPRSSSNLSQPCANPPAQPAPKGSTTPTSTNTCPHRSTGGSARSARARRAAGLSMGSLRAGSGSLRTGGRWVRGRSRSGFMELAKARSAEGSGGGARG